MPALRPVRAWLVKRGAANFAKVLVGIFLAVIAWADGDNVLDLSKSTISVTFKQEGVPVDAEFRHFSGQVVYDSSKPDSSLVSMDVEANSLDIGDEEYNREVRRKPWLDGTTYPMASFRSAQVKPQGLTRFLVTGTLLLKGHSEMLTVPVTVTTQGGEVAFDGTFEVSRKAFDIGDPIWNASVEDAVRVSFHLVNSNR